MGPSWEMLLVAFLGGSLMATAISAFLKYKIFHPVISVRLDTTRGSYGPVTLYHHDREGKFIGATEAKFFGFGLRTPGSHPLEIAAAS